MIIIHGEWWLLFDHDADESWLDLVFEASIFVYYI